MATAAAELFVKVSADIKGLTSGLDSAAKAATDLGKETKSAAADVGKLSGSMDGLKAAAAGVGLAAIAGGIAMVGQRAITLAAELEQAKIGFTTMLGGATQADAFLRDLTQFAATTPFELRGLVDSSKRLLAFGFEAKGVIPIMTAVGNAVAGLGGGKEVLDGVTTALGQMAAKGKVSAEEMNQLAERGIPAWKMLADGIGVSIPQAMKMAEKGAIDANKAIVAIVNGMNEKFPDMMQKQSQSFAGAMSNLQDSTDIALTKIGTKLMEALKLTDIIKALSAGISNLTDAFVKGGLIAAIDRAFGPAAKAAIVGFGAVVVSSATPAIVAMGSALLTAAASAAPFVAAGITIAAAAYPIIKNWEGVRDTTIAFFDVAAQYASAWYNRAARVFSDFASMAADALRYVADWIRDTFGVDIAAKLGVGLAKAGKAFGGFKQMAVEGLNVVTSSLKSTGNSIAADFTKAFRGGAEAVRGSMGKVTAEMLGLKAATQDASKAASSKAKALKEVAKAVKEAEKETARLAKQTGDLFKKYQSQEMATYKLGDALARARKEAEEKGRSFDLAGATAQAYSDNITSLEQAFGKMSPQAVGARGEMEKMRQASEGGGKALAEAFGIIDKGKTQLDAAAQKAAIMGKEFDEVAEAVGSAERVLGELIDRGLGPGNLAFDEAAKRLSDMRKAAEEAKNPLGDLREATGTISQNLGSLAGNVKTVTEALGVEGLAPIIDATAKMGQFGQAVIGIVGNIEGLTKAATAVGTFFASTLIPALTTIGNIIGTVVVGAVNSLTIAIAANPIGAIIVGVVALVAAGLWLYENWDYVVGELSKAWEWMKTGALSAFEAIGKGVSTIWDGIVGVIKGSVNAVIGLVNLLIRGLNRINVNIPSWVPNIGGRSFGVNIPQVPYLATGGIVTSPTMARLGEGGRPEAVLPLNENVYRQIGQGIVSARGGGGGTQVVVQYYGSGKWTREDAQGLGRLLVSELRTMGVKA